MTRILTALFAIALFVEAAAGQAAAGDTLRLGQLQSEALRTDPREAVFRLLRAQSDLRMQSLGAERLPGFTMDSYAQYQSDVARIPITLPGMSVPTPPHDTYEARLIAQQRIYDPTLGPRRNIEQAQLADAQARVRSSLYSLRQSVTDSYFSALAAQEQLAEIRTSITDLDAQLKVASARVREGTALPGEANAIRAELLRRRQMEDQAYTNQITALTLMFSLAGRKGSVDGQRLALPDTSIVVGLLRTAVTNDFSRRPEFESFRAAAALIARQRDARLAQDRPRVSAYGRTGRGRPGLNPLATSWDSYWLTGVQLQWSPFNWGTGERDRQVLDLQSRIVQSEADALKRALEREVSRGTLQITGMLHALKYDDEIIALREEIFGEAAAKYREGVITSAEYVDRQTDVLSARVARASHRVELARARAALMNTIGLEEKK